MNEAVVPKQQLELIANTIRKNTNNKVRLSLSPQIIVDNTYQHSDLEYLIPILTTEFPKYKFQIYRNEGNIGFNVTYKK
jgi:hypothetical protein